jgi:hypothetical protein
VVESIPVWVYHRDDGNQTVIMLLIQSLFLCQDRDTDLRRCFVAGVGAMMVCSLSGSRSLAYLVCRMCAAAVARRRRGGKALMTICGCHRTLCMASDQLFQVSSRIYLARRVSFNKRRIGIWLFPMSMSMSLEPQNQY